MRGALTLATFKSIPKAELHFHMDGSMRVSTIIDIARRDGVSLPTWDEAQLSALVRVGRNCASLVEFLKAYEITLSVMQTKYGIERVAYEAFELCHEDGISYVEARFSPVLHTRNGLTLDDVMECVTAGRQAAEKKLGIKTGIIVCAMRQNPPEEAVALARLASKHRQDVVGFDIAGPEKGFSASLFREAYRIAAEAGLGLTAHSGEADDFTSIDRAVNDLNVTRIGHGVTMRDSTETQKLVKERRVCVECCPTSNVLTKAVGSFETHPLAKFLENGIVATLCSDGFTQTDTTLSNEYYLAHTEMHLSNEMLLKCIENGFMNAFQPLSVREHLAKEALSVAKRLLN